MKKYFVATLLSGLASISFADSFQDFNNNIYADYNLISPNAGAYSNYDAYGVGGTFQSNTNVWGNAEVITGSGSYNNNEERPAFNSSLISVRGGYAFQFFRNDLNGFQVIPYGFFNAGNINVATEGGNMGYQSYGLGVIPEYRFGEALKLSLDVAIGSTNFGNAPLNDGSDQQIYYSVAPSIEYDINKTILLGVSYSYSNAFNSSSSETEVGNSVLTAKIGYLF